MTNVRLDKAKSTYQRLSIQDNDAYLQHRKQRNAITFGYELLTLYCLEFLL